MSDETIGFLETDLTSDILIYNLLKNSDDPFIQEFNIKFIDRSVPSEESNTIYIANMKNAYPPDVNICRMNDFVI